MTRLEFAQITWAHFGQQIESLNQESYDTKIFNAVYEQSLRATIFKGCPADFVFPFRPKLVYEQQAASNPYPDWFVFAWPTSLILIKNRDETMPNRLYPERNQYRTVVDINTNQKYILGKVLDLRMEGAFLVDNLSHWSPQAIETASLYCAWMVSKKISDEKTREKLKKELDMSFDELKVYSEGQNDGDMQEQHSSWTDTIDFNTASFSRDRFGTY